MEDGKLVLAGCLATSISISAPMVSKQVDSIGELSKYKSKLASYKLSCFEDKYKCQYKG